MRLEIDAGGRKVSAEVSDTNTSPRELLAELLDAWKQTEGVKYPSNGPALGFSHSGAQATPRGRYSLAMGEGEPLPVRVEGASDV